MDLKVYRYHFGVWSLNAKQALLILSFFHTLLHVIHCASTQRVENFSSGLNNKHITSWDLTNTDKNAALYSSLLDILEKLDLVQSGDNYSACVSLGKIVREVEPLTPDGISKSIKLTFHLTDTPHSTANRESAQYDNSSKDKNVPSYSIEGVNSPRCNKSSSFLTKGLDSLSRKQDDTDTGAKTMSDKDGLGHVNGTGAVPLALEPKDGIQKGEEKGLSRTQIVVISTCSAVIGLFFLIAGTIRIRNYYKRYLLRREREQNGGTSRGSSLRLPGSTNSSCNLRRDSSCSKASRQTNKSGGDSQIAKQDKRLDKLSLFPHSSPALSVADQKPLLAGHSGKLSQHSNGSSHGSIAYIDEDTSSRIKIGDTTDLGSDENEDFPLLRKSPDSGSYVSLASESEKQRAHDPNSNNIHSEEGPMNDAHGSVDTFSNNANTNLTTSENDTSRKDKTVDDVETPSDSSYIQENMDKLKHNGASSPEYSDTEYDNLCKSSVVNVGLNQSNSSISENPSYSYGNQLEYSPYSGFDYGYSDIYEDDIIKNDRFQIDWHGNSGFVSNLLENEGNYRGNGACDVANSLPDVSSNDIHLSDHVTSSRIYPESNTGDSSNEKHLSDSVHIPNQCLSIVPHQPVFAGNQSV